MATSAKVGQDSPRSRSYRLPLFFAAVLGATLLALAACRSLTVEPMGTLMAPTPGPAPSRTPTPPLWLTLSPAAPPEACAPPCWYGIIPGETSFDEALGIIASLPFAGNIRTFEQNRSTWIAWFARTKLDSPYQRDGLVETKGGLVTSIVIFPFPRLTRYNGGSPAAGLAAGDVVEQHGPPDVAWPIIYGVEDLWFEVGLWYPDQGVAYYATGVLDPGRYCLDPDSQVFRGEFSVPMTLDEYIDYRFSPFTELAQELVPWPGFGCSGWFE